MRWKTWMRWQRHKRPFYGRTDFFDQREESISSWWLSFNPWMKNMRKSNWIIFPGFRVKYLINILKPPPTRWFNSWPFKIPQFSRSRFHHPKKGHVFTIRRKVTSRIARCLVKNLGPLQTERLPVGWSQGFPWFSPVWRWCSELPVSWWEMFSKFPGGYMSWK